MKGHSLTVRRRIAADPETIFALLADASQHRRIDGSGLVKEEVGTPEPLQLGSVFGMNMRLGLPYRSRNTVIEFVPDRRIAWKTTFGPGWLSRVAAGRIWRYTLDRAGAATIVTETWDVSEDHQRFLLRHSALPRVTRENMERTLRRIARIVE